MLFLQNVPPAVLICFLPEFKVDAYTGTALKHNREAVNQFYLVTQSNMKRNMRPYPAYAIYHISNLKKKKQRFLGIPGLMAFRCLLFNWGGIRLVTKMLFCPETSIFYKCIFPSHFHFIECDGESVLSLLFSHALNEEMFSR